MEYIYPCSSFMVPQGIISFRFCCPQMRDSTLNMKSSANAGSQNSPFSVLHPGPSRLVYKDITIQKTL